MHLKANESKSDAGAVAEDRMRIRYTDATGCPYGQFVVNADNDQEKAILSSFVHADRNKWRFHLHGYGLRALESGISNFNFGWVNHTPKWKYYKRGKIRIWLAYTFSYLSDLFLELARKI